MLYYTAVVFTVCYFAFLFIGMIFDYPYLMMSGGMCALVAVGCLLMLHSRKL
jgi:hypothetical protein